MRRGRDSNNVEIRCPPAESILSAKLFVFAKKKGVELVFGCWTSDLAILDFDLARKH